MRIRYKVLSTLVPLLLGQVGLVVFGPGPTSSATGEPALLYVFAGQSNMVGAATNTAELATVDPSLHAPPQNVQFWGPNEDTPLKQWGPVEPPTEVQQAFSHMGFGPEISASPLLSARHPQATIGVVKVARNGTTLFGAWNARNPVGLYPVLIAEVEAAKSRLETETRGPVRIAGFFWMQGESDAEFRTMAQGYAGNLEAFIAAVRRDLETPQMPFVIGQIPDATPDLTTLRYSSTVRAAERSVAKHVPQTFFVPTDGLERAAGSPVHFDTRGTVDLGRRLVNSTFPV